MLALIQRVNFTRIRIDGQLHAEIGKGLLAFVGVEALDEKPQADKLLDKLLAYRVFADADGKMNLDLASIEGELMVVSQFTLVANTRKGLRPSFSSAKPPVEAEKLYNYFVDIALGKHRVVKSGKFAADMKIELENDGPVTFFLQS
jgi:D-tyrosyl-tRNA(Tyr) deacylase